MSYAVRCEGCGTYGDLPQQGDAPMYGEAPQGWYRVGAVASGDNEHVRPGHACSLSCVADVAKVQALASVERQQRRVAAAPSG